MDRAPLLEIADTVIRLDRTAEAPFRLHVPEFRLMPGELIALVGPSGAGKTTFLEYLAALRSAEAVGLHRMTVPGAPPIDLSRQMMRGDLDGLARLRSGPVGYVAQAGALIPFLNAGANAAINLDLCGESLDPGRRRRFDELVQRLGLGAHLLKDRGQLSGGQRKRVALLRGMARPRALLLLDEPFAGLDATMAGQVLDLILWIAAEERTGFVVVTHDHAAALNRGFGVYHVQSDGGNATVLPGPEPQGGRPWT